MVIFPTDKSAKLAIDTPSNYVSIMEKHLEGAQEVSAEDHNQIEIVLNAYMKSWFLILQGNSRLRNNFISTNNDVAPLYGLCKDHKPMDNEVLGPPTRPVCGAVTSCNYRISYFLSQFLKPLTREAPETCESTEDLLSRIHECNENEDLQDCIIGSMDVEALYP